MLCRELGTDLSHAAAIGDSENDLEMLRAVELPIAMGNASDAVKGDLQAANAGPMRRTASARPPIDRILAETDEDRNTAFCGKWWYPARRYAIIIVYVILPHQKETYHMSLWFVFCRCGAGPDRVSARVLVGHLVLVQTLFGDGVETNYMLFNVLLHFGTLLSVIVAFWRTSRAVCGVLRLDS